jgi:hypothetical protein
MQSTTLEGIGGRPVHVDLPNFEGIDPTLDSCCRRDEEDQRRSAALKRTLQRHDVVAERERRRRNLVQTISTNIGHEQGCRCRYDPNQDGGEYPALVELRRQRHDGDRGDEKQRKEPLSDGKKENDSENNDDSDDDDEFDYLLDEDLPGQSEELRWLEEARRAELEWELLQRETALQHGYGVHRQMHPSRVLNAAGVTTETKRMLAAVAPVVVLHLYDPESMASASLDLHLEELAQTTRGTVFLRSHGRGTLLSNRGCRNLLFPKQHERRSVEDVVDSDLLLPALIAIRDGVAVHACPRLQNLVEDARSLASSMVVPEAVNMWLRQSGVLRDEPPSCSMNLCQIRPEEQALLDNLRAENNFGKKQQKQQRAFEEEEEEQFDCGVEGCQKCFPHEHVGIRNEQQAGLVVPEAQVLGDAE